MRQSTIDMPPVHAPAQALVTGANGFIGAWVVRTLLEQGYSVLGIVRSTKKGEHLKKRFAPYGDRFSLSVIDDITKVCTSSLCGRISTTKSNPI